MFANIKQPKEGMNFVVRCIHFIARIFGFWPFFIGNQPIRRRQRIFLTISTILWYTWAVILILLHVGSICLRIVYHDPLKMTIPFSVKWMISAVITSIMILSTILDVMNRNRIREIAAKFNEFDMEVDLMVWPHIY